MQIAKAAEKLGKAILSFRKQIELNLLGWLRNESNKKVSHVSISSSVHTGSSPGI